MTEALLLVVWTGFWFWAFSFAFDDGYFEYHRHARIPAFVAALAAAVVLPVSAVGQWRGFDRAVRSGRRALTSHLAVCSITLAAFYGLFAALSRAPSPWRLEADDGMGVAIDFLLLVGIAAASSVALTVGISIRWYRRRSLAERG